MESLEVSFTADYMEAEVWCCLCLNTSPTYGSSARQQIASVASMVMRIQKIEASIQHI